MKKRIFTLSLAAMMLMMQGCSGNGGTNAENDTAKTEVTSGEAAEEVQAEEVPIA